ncbi:hypothetical protein ABT404_02925 [Streptomyces hyaluromycini]|uniref:Uncharacterized protein n=1 Tax=Streptomyces hyaluromycini TaxID=1377993 RepID=A0ABV1WNK2_9ACTN
MLLALVTTVMTVPLLSLLDRRDARPRASAETHEGEEPAATLD